MFKYKLKTLFSNNKILLVDEFLKNGILLRICSHQGFSVTFKSAISFSKNKCVIAEFSTHFLLCAL